MQEDATVLVIAPDPDFRRSIAFLLRAEGYDVTHHEALPAEIGSRPPERCAVVDEASIGDGDDFRERLRRLADTIVVLRSVPRELPGMGFVQTVDKPMLGASLVEAVQAAFHRSGGLTT